MGVVGTKAEEYVASVVDHGHHTTHLDHADHTQAGIHQVSPTHDSHEARDMAEVHTATHAAIQTQTTQSVSVPVYESSRDEVAVLPHNLPTVGFDELYFNAPQSEKEDEEQLGLLENTAHKSKVLLSSDAMRYFVGNVGSYAEQKEVFEALLKKARVSFPSEEGWVALDQARMEHVIDLVKEKHVHTHLETNTDLEHSVSYKPMTAGSLAEAIVTKNVVAAYMLMANRPMIALADAASDLEGVLRGRKGEEVVVSDLLKTHTDTLSTDTLESVTLALTSALDGTYTTEEEAVKMAILKAVQTLK